MVVAAMRGTLKATMLQTLIDKRFDLFEQIGNRHLFENIAKDLFPDGDGFGSMHEGTLIRLIIDTPITEDHVDFIVTERDTFDYTDNVI